MGPASKGEGRQGVRPLPWEEKKKSWHLWFMSTFYNVYDISRKSKETVMTKMLAVVLFYCY